VALCFNDRKTKPTEYIKGEVAVLVELFPLIASAMAVLCLFVVGAEEIYQ
jgi:hypothetical protein